MTQHNDIDAVTPYNWYYSGATTFSIRTFSRMTFSITTLSKATLSIATLSIVTLSIMVECCFVVSFMLTIM